MSRLRPSPLGSWRWTLALGLAATGLLGLAGPASAYHIPGATYTGERPAGPGAVITSTWKVAKDGSTVTYFEVGPVGTFTTSPMPISDHHRFVGPSHERPDLCMRGAFDDKLYANGPQTVGGVLHPCEGGIGGEREGKTKASPAGSEECQIAIKHFKRAKKKLKNADTASAEKKAEKLLEKAKQEKRDCGL
jgi:hypothetical protein